MKRIRFVAGAVVAIVALVVGALFLAPSASGAGSKTLSPGLIQFDASSIVLFQVYNPTDKDFSAIATIDNAIGFSAFSPANVLVPAHGKSSTNFTCSSTGGCEGVPVLTGPSKAIPSLGYVEPTASTTPVQATLPAGGWRIV